GQGAIDIVDHTADMPLLVVGRDDDQQILHACSVSICSRLAERALTEHQVSRRLPVQHLIIAVWFGSCGSTKCLPLRVSRGSDRGRWHTAALEEDPCFG